MSSRLDRSLSISSSTISQQQSQQTQNTPQSSLRRIGEDPILRPFLSSLFDPQAYVKNVIKDGKSEECFNAITDCVEKINEEIQRYISQNKVKTSAMAPLFSFL